MDSEKKPLQICDDLLFPKIFQTFRMAIQPSKLIIAFSAIAVLWLAGWIMDRSNTVVTTPYTQNRETELQIYMTDPQQVETYIESYKQSGSHTGVFSTLWCFAADKFQASLNALFAFNLPAVAANIAEWFKAAGWALKYHTVYCIIFGVIKLAVIALAGGAICRIAALQFAQGEKPGLTEAMRFSTKRFLTFFTVPLAPIGMIIFVGLFIFLLGLIGNLPWLGELIIAVFMPLALIAGSLVAIILIGTAAGFNLMFPAVAYDGSDCFDAIGRSFSYVYAKPWRMGFYTAIAVVYGAICYTFVRFFAFLLLFATHLFLRLGVWAENSKEANKLIAIWPEPAFTSGLATANWSQSLAAFLIHLFLLLILGLVVSFVISFYFSANTVIYSLMRKRVDNIALEDVYTSFNDAETEPTAADRQKSGQTPQSDSDTQADSSSQNQ